MELVLTYTPRKLEIENIIKKMFNFYWSYWENWFWNM